jgi:hypothetical protein
VTHSKQKQFDPIDSNRLHSPELLFPEEGSDSKQEREFIEVKVQKPATVEEAKLRLRSIDLELTDIRKRLQESPDSFTIDLRNRGLNLRAECLILSRWLQDPREVVTIKVDTRNAFVHPPPPPPIKSRATSEEIKRESISAVIRHAAIHGEKSLTRADLAIMESFVEDQRKRIDVRESQLKAFEEVRRLSNSIFYPDLKPFEEVTGERLTELFKAHSAMPRSRFKSDTKKQRYCDLVRAFWEAGGVVLRDGEEVKMNLFTPYKATEKAFRTVLPGSGNKRANSHWTPPPLVFSIVPHDA